MHLECASLACPRGSDWTVWVRKLKWMLIAVLMPEYVAIMAAPELWDARYLRRKIQLFCEGGMSAGTSGGWVEED